MVTPETLQLIPCDEIRMGWQQTIEIFILFWTEEITIKGFKLLFCLFLAVKIPCGIIFRCMMKSKNKLMTESNYFV
jgi:hypothetical protein